MTAGSQARSADEIDPLLRDLVRELNAAGHETWSSCQGKTCPEDFAAGRHCDHSFLTFTELPRRIRSRARRLGLYVYNGGTSISGLTGDEVTQEDIIRRNLAFSALVRKLFELSGS